MARAIKRDADIHRDLALLGPNNGDPCGVVFRNAMLRLDVAELGKYKRLRLSSRPSQDPRNEFVLLLASRQARWIN